MRVTSTSPENLIVSCYELGHQPLAAASALAFLERAGHGPHAVDLSVEPLDRLDAGRRLDRLRLAAVSVPMHTALAVGVRAAARIRRAAPAAHICFYGLYATLNAEYLLGDLADSVIGGEFEQPLVALADALAGKRPIDDIEGLGLPGRPAAPYLARLPFAVPSRKPLPSLKHYARLSASGREGRAAAVEASRGCLHVCRHCPITPVYGGRFFVVPRDVVLEDVRRLTADGVTHITFADPDFFNGPGHSMAIVRALREEFPGLTFDVTTKVEHVLEHRGKFEELAASGCLFVVTAVESLSDEVLRLLRKGHTRRDVFEALAILRRAGIAMRPSLVAFTPWTHLEDYVDVLDWVEREGLVLHLDPVQYSIRLLVPPGSTLLALDELQPHLRGLRPERFSYAWEHPDPRMDRLHREVSAIVEQAALRGEDAGVTFKRIRDVAYAACGRVALLADRFPPARAGSPPPRLTEPWFC